MAGIITKNDENHPDHAVYKTREKARAAEAEKAAPAKKPVEAAKAETPDQPKK